MGDSSQLTALITFCKQWDSIGNSNQLTALITLCK